VALEYAPSDFEPPEGAVANTLLLEKEVKWKRRAALGHDRVAAESVLRVGAGICQVQAPLSLWPARPHSSPRLHILVDGLCQTAAGLDALTEGRVPDPIEVAIGTREPSGPWFEHVPELNVLFNAMAVLKTATTACGYWNRKIVSVNALERSQKACAHWLGNFASAYRKRRMCDDDERFLIRSVLQRN
jgi:hypothetical protein